MLRKCPSKDRQHGSRIVSGQQGMPAVSTLISNSYIAMQGLTEARISIIRMISKINIGWTYLEATVFNFLSATGSFSRTAEGVLIACGFLVIFAAVLTLFLYK